MADINTKYIRKVIIESENGKTMDELDFTLDFFVYANRLQTLKKSELIRVVKGGEASYYAVIDSQKLGRGDVKCRAIIVDVEPRIKDMERPVVLTREVGIMIGGCCCYIPYNHDCERFEEGYKVSFEAVTDIPKQDAQPLMYGILHDDIISYGDITPKMVYGFQTANSLNGVSIGELVPGDKVVILVDGDNPNHVLKNDGFGKYVPFDTNVIGSNGDYEIVVDDKAYRLYGEMMLVSGELYFKLKID